MKINAYFDKSNSQGDASWRMMNDAYYKMPWDNPYDENGVQVFIHSSKRPGGGDWYSQDTWTALQNTLYD